MYRVEFAFGISEVWRPLVATSAPVPPKVWAVRMPEEAPTPMAFVVRIPRTALRFPVGARGVLTSGRLRVRDGRGRVVRHGAFDVPPPFTEPCSVSWSSGTLDRAAAR